MTTAISGRNAAERPVADSFSLKILMMEPASQARSRGRKFLDQSPQHPRAGVGRLDMLIWAMADAATTAHKGFGDVNLQREIAAL